MENFIYHLVHPAEWRKYIPLDYFEAGSLQTEGFIHCSYWNQIGGVVGKYYSDATEIVLLTLDPSNLTAPLILEAAKDGNIYPHIYGQINKSAIIKVENFKIANQRLI